MKEKLNKYLKEAGIQLSPDCQSDINRLKHNPVLYEKFVNSILNNEQEFNADSSLIHAFCVYFIYFLNDTGADSKDIVYNFELSFDGHWDDKCEYAKDYFASGDYRYTDDEIKEMGWEAYADRLLSSEDVWEYNNFYFLNYEV